MNCYNCAAVLPDDNVFCEECGKRLDGTEPAPACSCGWNELDEDGYCTSCGRHSRDVGREREELVLAPEFAAVSDPGLRRTKNEDRFAIHKAGSTYALVVCDGVSSSQESQRAAALASATASDALAASGDLTSPMESMQTAIRSAAEAVRSLSRADRDKEPPSTTLVAALVSGGRAAIGWIGDSRAYWISESAVRQLTVDHSWMNAVVSSGQMTQAAAEKSPNSHAITRWLGADSGDEIQPEFVELALDEPGTLVLCSDGLWNYLEDAEELREMVGNEASAVVAARRAVEFALSKGGHDNVTVAVLQVRAKVAPEPGLETSANPSGDSASGQGAADEANAPGA